MFLFLRVGQGSGPSGRIRAQDLSKASAPGVTPVIDVTAPVTPSVEGDFVDIPLSNIRKVSYFLNDCNCLILGLPNIYEYIDNLNSTQLN